MTVKYMFRGSSCAGVVSAGVTCFFIGLVMLLWGIWDMVDHAGNDALFLELSSRVIIVSVFIWLWGWYFLHTSWKSKHIRRSDAYKTAIILILTGLCSTFFSILGNTLQ